MSPRALLGAALLFWGWQTGFLAVAAGMALALEARQARRLEALTELKRAELDR